MKQSILAGHSIAPIVVVKTSDGYKVADGNHRVTALRELGETTTAAYIATGVGDFGPWDVQMQNDAMKKSTEPDLEKKTSDSGIVYKSLTPEALATLQVGDVIYDDDVVLFTSVRPEGPVALTADLPSGRLLPGEALIVSEVNNDEVVLERA